MKPVLCIIGLAAVAGCAQIHTDGALDGDVPSGGSEWPAAYHDTFDRVAVAAGLLPLEAASTEGRELRIWAETPFLAPRQLYRIVESEGRVSGELIHFWEAEPPDRALGQRRGETFHDLMLYSMRGRCDRVRVHAGYAVCRALFTTAPDWASILHRLDTTGVQRIRGASIQPAQLPGLDGWPIQVEARDGTEYRTFRHWIPPRNGDPDENASIGLVETLMGIDSLERAGDQLRLHRGVTAGRWLTAFRPCDSDETWDVGMDLRREAARAGITIPADPLNPGPFYVELLGEATPRWLARLRLSNTPRHLQVVEVRKAARWSGIECEAPPDSAAAARDLAALSDSLAKLPPLPRNEVLSDIMRRGRALAEIDRLVSGARTALDTLDLPREGIEIHAVYLTRRGWRVGFGRLSRDGNEFLVSYEATQTHIDRFGAVRRSPPLLVTDSTAVQARALATAWRSFAAPPGRYQARVLPTLYDNEWLVYFLPARRAPAAFPLGPDFRYRVSADGRRVTAREQLHDGSLEFSPGDSAAPPAFGAHTTRENTPVETDVHHVLVREPKVPQYVFTPDLVYLIDTNGQVRVYARRERAEDGTAKCAHC